MSTTLTALLLATAASLAWSGLDSARKILSSRISPAALLFLVTGATAPLFALWTAVDGLPEVGRGYALPAFGSVVLNVLANLGFFVAIRSSPLSLTIPLLSLTPVFTTLLAIPTLGERPTLMQAAGIALVVVGALLLNLRRRDPAAGSFWRAMVHERGPLWMAVVALLWSVSIPLDKMAADRASAPFHGLVLNAGVAAFALILVLRQGTFHEVQRVREMPGTFGVTLLLSTLALGLQLLALQLIWVGFVETLKRGIGNGMALILGRFLFAEVITPGKVAAVLLMGVGVALILV
ncbi:MAG TPA: DMT family transporter [Thermoanaerobaculia bacterium]|nr:DMT family transporter [Thermoanaerobaculia bacterium]